jgi:hypothetical protein
MTQEATGFERDSLLGWVFLHQSIRIRSKLEFHNYSTIFAGFVFGDEMIIFDYENLLSGLKDIPLSGLFSITIKFSGTRSFG